MQELDQSLKPYILIAYNINSTQSKETNLTKQNNDNTRTI